MEGEIQMNDILKKDITMKAISILIAVILWFMVLDQSNPFEEPRGFNIPLKIINQDKLTQKNIIIKNINSIPQTVEIKLQGRHDKIIKINERDFEATLDLSKISDSKTKALQIDGPTYIGKENIREVIRTMSPLKVDLELDTVVNNVFRVEAKTGGKLKDKYKIVSITTTPDSFQLQDIDSLLQTVGSINAIVDVSNLDKDLEIKQKCTVFDKDNKVITNAFKSLYVDVKITVAKEVVVKPVIEGSPAPNFLNVSNISSPQMVLISGQYDLISKIDELLTSPISIENQNQNAIISSPLILPEGVALVNNPQEVTVSLGIEPLAKRTFVFTMKDILVINPEIDNSLKYEIVASEISIDIKGPKDELDKLSLAKIAPSIDVNKLAEGNYKVPLKVTLPLTVRLAQDYEIDISILKR